MADISLPTTVVPGADAYSVEGVTAGAYSQGNVVYRDTNRQYGKANAGTLATAIAVGILMETAGVANTPVHIQTSGHITGCAGLTAGTFYYLSDTVAGDICLFTDLLAGARVVQIGYAISATELVLNIVDTGITI